MTTELEKGNYLKKNLAYWSHGYPAENVESWVFRLYGRILRHEFGIDGSNGERLLDFGCGQGATCRYFHAKGFDVYGVDISEPDISFCKSRLPAFADHYKVISPKPALGQSYFGKKFNIVTGIQSLYYFTDTDFNILLRNIFEQMESGAFIYGTMIATRHKLYRYSSPQSDGLSVVEYQGPRNKIAGYYVNFTEDEGDLVEKFKLFEPIHIGHYALKYRSDEEEEVHLTFFGRKR